MSTVVAIMSMSLDGYVAEPNDGVVAAFRCGEPGMADERRHP